MIEIINACKAYCVQCAGTKEMLKRINIEYDFNDNMFDHFCSLSDELLSNSGLKKDMESFNKVMEIVTSEKEVKTLKSVTLENGIRVELLEDGDIYQVVSSAGGFAEKIAYLDRAITKYENRVKLYSRFVKSAI